MCKDSNKEIYIVLSGSNGALSLIIKKITGAKFSHASLSFDKDLKEMYSFGRLYKYCAFLGGYVVESPQFGTFKRFINSDIEILKINIDNDTYDKLRSQIKYMHDFRRKYTYNYIGLLLAPFGICYKHRNWYYCSEFVRDILVKYKVIVYNTNDIIRPEEFTRLSNVDIVYIGTLNNYLESRGLNNPNHSILLSISNLLSGVLNVNT